MKIIIALLFLFMPIVILGQDSRPAQFTLKDIQGRYIRLSDYRGKVVLVNFGPPGVHRVVRKFPT